MHVLAYVYHWDVKTIWSLPRNERKMWVDLIKEQYEAEQKQLNNGGSIPNSYAESM